jgi:hypothetical protein
MDLGYTFICDGSELRMILSYGREKIKNVCRRTFGQNTLHIKDKTGGIR